MTRFFAAQTVVLVAFVGTTSAAWWAHWTRESAYSSAARLSRAVQYQYLLPGVRFPLDSLVRVESAPVATTAATRGHLLFVVSDECAYCRDEMPAWRDLIDRTPPDVQLWLIAKSGRNFADDLRRRAESAGVPVVVAAPLDNRRFAVVTGLRGTPGTVLLDQSFNARLIGWRLSPDVLSVFREELRAWPASPASRLSIASTTSR